MKRTLLAAACAALTLPAVAQSQAFPQKPIRIVSQYQPGSSGDSSLRIVTPAMSKSLGQPIVLDNRPGAGGILAAEQVLRAAPDGYTLVAGSSALYVIRPFLVKAMPFDTQKDFTPVTLYQEAFAILVGTPSLPANSFKELMDYARANPNKVSYGTSGIGTEGHLSGVQISELTGIKWTHVPYKASSAAMQDTIGGQVSTSFAIYAAAIGGIKAGKMKPLAVVMDKRSPRMPDVPTVSELVPGFEAPAFWTGVFGPAGMPPDLTRRIQSEFAKAVKDPETATKLSDGGFDVVVSSPEDFAARIKREMVVTGRLVKAAGIKPE